MERLDRCLWLAARGAWDSNEFGLRCSDYNVNAATLESDFVGFRLASVPEPSAIVLTVLFGTGFIYRRKRNG
jgi:hypothetical protein